MNKTYIYLIKLKFKIIIIIEKLNKIITLLKGHIDIGRQPLIDILKIDL